MAAESITGLVLAGGAGRRMGGADKGLVEYLGRPLVAHVIDRLAPQVESLIVSANRHLADYRAFGHPLVSDGEPDYPGPLAGLAAGLAACRTEWLVCVPCDCPHLPPDLVGRLAAAPYNSGARLAVARVAGQIQPTFQLCHRSHLPALRDYLAAGERRVGGWCRQQGAVEVDFPDPEAFRNFNTPAELDAPRQGSA